MVGSECFSSHGDLWVFQCFNRLSGLGYFITLCGLCITVHKVTWSVKMDLVVLVF